MADKYFLQNNWTGNSESEFLGQKGSFSKSFAIDLHTNPGVVRCAFAPQKESGGTVTELCNFAVDSSSGTSYWFGSDGNIYYRNISVGGVASFGTVYKDTATINGAGEFDGFIYWTVGNNLRRIATNGNWTSGVTTSYGSVNTSTYHPMVDMGTYLLIGNGTAVASVDDTGTVTASGIPDVSLNWLPANYQITSLHKYGIDVLVGTKVSGAKEGAKLLRWDLASPSWTQEIDVPENSVNCFLTTSNQTYFQAGGFGMFYKYDGTSIEPFKRIFDQNGDTGNSSFSCHPQSAANYRGFGYFGPSILSYGGSPVGLYNFGRITSSYPISVYHEFAQSSFAGGTSQVTIGAVISGFHTATSIPYLVYSWKDEIAETYGIDAIFNPTIYNTDSYLETMAISGNRYSQKLFSKYDLAYRSKPTGSDINLQYYSNFSTTPTGTITMDDKSGYNKLVSNEKIDVGTMKFKINLTNGNNNTPELEEFYTEFNERPIL